MTQFWSDVEFGVSLYFLNLYFVRHRRHFLFIDFLVPRATFPDFRRTIRIQSNITACSAWRTIYHADLRTGAAVQIRKISGCHPEIVLFLIGQLLVIRLDAVIIHIQSEP